MAEIVYRSPYKMTNFYEDYDYPEECLSLLYDPDLISFSIGMIRMKDNEFEQQLEIVYDNENVWEYAASEKCFSSGEKVTSSKLYCIRYNAPDDKDFMPYTKSFAPDQPCPYHDLFEEMDIQEDAERKKAFGLLNDSRNFSRRISAKIIDNELHIFYETYNYDKPELGEYYLMDYCRGTYHFSIADRSRFMTLYLTPEKYRKLYGECQAEIKEQYESSEPLKKALAEIAKYDYDYGYDIDRRTAKQKLQAFRRMQKEIDLMSLKLKFKRAFIRSRDALWLPIPGTEYIEAMYILNYYNAKKQFGCTGLDDLDWMELSVECYNRSKKRAVFQLSDGRIVKLSRKDLDRGYELGLDTIDEIGQFLLKYGGLSIRKCLKQTG